MGEIVVRDSELIDRRLTSSVSAPRDLRKYIRSSNFFAIYDTDIAPNRSILNIPLLATVLPLAWLTGSDIQVDELDSTFKGSMDTLKAEFKEMYPEAPFTTEIMADVLIENHVEVDPSRRTAMLFSGGVDSTYSLITNLHLKPRLIMYWGVERGPYPNYPKYWENVIRIYSEFARGKGLTLHPVKTNAMEMLHAMRIEHDFHELLYNGSLWKTLQHSLVLLPLTAPLSIGRFDRLIIASSYHPEHPSILSQRPMSQRPETDETTAWANLRVKHHGFIPKPEKITGRITEYLKKDKLTLRVCLHNRDEQEKLNCCHCEKCMKTILTLILTRVDPNLCGFEVDGSTFSKMRHYLSRAFEGKEPITSSLIESQKMIPDKIEYDLHGSKEFFEWFKELELERSHGKNVEIYRDLYNKLPFPISKYLDKFYTIMGIKLHGRIPTLPHTRKQWKLTQENQKLNT